MIDVATAQRDATLTRARVIACVRLISAFFVFETDATAPVLIASWGVGREPAEDRFKTMEGVER